MLKIYLLAGLNYVGCDLACQFSFEIPLPEGTEWDWKVAIWCMEVSILKSWGIYELGGGVLSIEAIQSVCRTEQDRI